MTSPPRLHAVIEGVRRRLGRLATRAALPWVGTFLCAGLLLAWVLVGATGWSQGTPAPLLLDGGLLTGLAVGVWGLRRGLRSRLSDASLTRSMEAATGLAPGAVRGALELSRSLPPGVSPALAERAERKVVRDLGLPEERLVHRLAAKTRTWERWGWGALAAATPMVALAAALTPERSAHAWRGLGAPVGLLARPVLPPVSVYPGDAEVRRGDDVEIVVSAPARDSVALRWQAAGDVPRRAWAEVVSGEVRFRITDVRAPVEYRAGTPDGMETGDFTLTPVDPLFVADVFLEVAFPSYTGRAPEEYRGEIPHLTVPTGTELVFRGTASRALAGGALVDTTGRTAAEMVPEGPNFAGRWRPASGGTFEWAFQGVDGTGAESVPPPLSLTVVPDSAPRVRFAFPARDTVLAPDLRQPLVLEARDDYGVTSLELVAYRVTSLGDRQQPVSRALPSGGGRAVLSRPVLDLTTWGLLPGDTVRYFARVRDNAPAPATGRTPEYALRMPTAAEMRRDAESRLHEAAASLEKLAERAARSEADTRDLLRRAGAPRPSPDRGVRIPGRPDRGRDPVGFRDREDLRRSLEEQAGMAAEVDSLRAALEEMAEAMRRAGVSDPGLRRTLEELEDVLGDMAAPEERERLEQLTQALEEMRGAQAEEALGELLSEQEAFREQLERSLERFRRAAVEQDFRATAAEAEELARQEEALADAFREEPDPSVRTAQQEELVERAEGMAERMERLEERLQQLGEQAAVAEVRQARDRTGESRRAMERALEEARRERGQEAGTRADEASDALDDATREMGQAQQQMAERQVRAQERALRAAVDDALALARRQAELGDEMEAAGRERMADLRGEVAALEEGVRNMAENVSSAAQGRPGGRELAERMGQAMAALRRTVEAMEGRSGTPSTPRNRAEAAVDALNQVALAAMAAARQGSQSGQAQGPGGSEGQTRRELEELAQRQGRLNNRAGQMMPLELGQEAMRAQIRQLSHGQRSVAGELDELSGRPGSDGEALGDLQALAEEARALADELAGGRIEAETRRRQERLFHRLLDAGRGLEDDELSEDRESRTGAALEGGEVPPLGPEELRTLRYRLPDAEALRRLTPAERRLVVRYFERLNRADPPAGRGGDPPADGGGTR